MSAEALIQDNDDQSLMEEKSAEIKVPQALNKDEQVESDSEELPEETNREAKVTLPNKSSNEKSKVPKS